MVDLMRNARYQRGLSAHFSGFKLKISRQVLSILRDEHNSKN